MQVCFVFSWALTFFRKILLGLGLCSIFFMLNYLTFSLSKLPTQLSNFFLLNKQPLEELLKIWAVFFLGELSIGSSFSVALQAFSL